MYESTKIVLPNCWVIVLAMLAVAGCGPGNGLTLAPVKGTVSHQGKPLDHGSVIFTPTGDTKGPQGEGPIESDGSFAIKTAGSSGAVVGQHIVTVNCRRVVTPEEARNLVVGELLIPQRYARMDQTPLRFEVKKGKNELPIELE